MPDKHLFEYAVIRLVPRVEREEFLNVGVILYSRSQKFLKAVSRIDAARLSAFSPSIDVEEIQSHLQAFERIAEGAADCGPIARLDNAGRFRWLTATRSTVVQTSKVHPGFCEDSETALNRLVTQLVL
jgi:hypothetical protein